MNTSLTIGRLAGIDIRIHASWFIIFLLVTWSLAVSYFPFTNPLAPAVVDWLLGALSALLLFVSVLLHELSHSLVAKSRGMNVHSITLFIFGGVSNLEDEPSQPSTEFWVSVAGPVSSFVLAALFYGAELSVGERNGAASAVLSYLAMINLLLGLFNLVPGFPLDGGRVLRAIVWTVTGSRTRATGFAARAGLMVAYLFMALGVFQLLSGNLLGGLWIAFIGWFLSGAAENAMRQETLATQFNGVRVADVMRSEPYTVGPNMTVAQLVDDYLLGRNLRGLPVTEHGQLVGMVTTGDVRKAAPDQWSHTPVRAIMAEADGLSTVRPDQPLADALRDMAAGDYERLPVVADGRLVGILSRSDVLRRLQVGTALRDPAAARAARERLEDERRRAA